MTFSLLTKHTQVAIDFIPNLVIAFDYGLSDDAITTFQIVI